MFARTRRLTLRPGWPEDAPALAAAIGREAVASGLARMPLPCTVADVGAFLAAPATNHEPRFLVWSHDADRPRLVGGVGLWRIEGAHHLGCWIAPEAWGRGYATEAAGAVVDIARHALPMNRLVAAHHRDDPAAGAVLRKLGFQETGTTDRVSSPPAGRAPCLLYALDLAPCPPLALAA